MITGASTLTSEAVRRQITEITERLERIERAVTGDGRREPQDSLT
ncbi:MAG TPA: hypothetical protein VME44_07995 [Streptosporangiaceae bacterium]|nr:hypothetical protein [Streptosporangiaceae bacterium]